MTAPPSRSRHAWWEDVQAILCGVTLCALSLQFLREAGLITGQSAGAALVASYATPYGFPVLFLTISLPFYVFALWRIGWVFTVKSLCAVGLLSAMTEVGPQVVTVGPTDPFVAAALAGLLAGFGLLALFRHGASLGGVAVVALWLQDAAGFRAGWTQMLVDAAVFAAAAFVIAPEAVLASLLGAAILNLVIAVNHRRDRYVAM
jgi:uncharacterized membrane-anchored protein YitT (DUF2179 family)